MAKILIVDDEDKYLDLCRRFITEHEFLAPARNCADALAVLAEHSEIDLVLLDVHFDIDESDLLPYDKAGFGTGAVRHRALERCRRTQGVEILTELRNKHPDLPVIMMTARSDLPLEVDAERLHAHDYTYLLDDEYLDARGLKLQIEEILAIRNRPHAEPDEPFYWGQTPHMQRLRRRLGVLARGQLPIILLGATGTGKSLVAREFIHPRSTRQGAFVAVDLSTIPSELMAAHLFGVVKGAFTGASATRDGVLARADGGTLFLDELGNLSLELQKALLLVLQEGRYSPVGSVDEKIADIKLVVATNENLAQMVRDGRFRQDLYMRLNPATAVTLPTLQDRRDDFSQLLEVFVHRVTQERYNRDLLLQYAEQRGLTLPRKGQPMPTSVGRSMPPRLNAKTIHLLIHPSSFRLLSEYAWPGNFRQLEMFLSNLITLTLVELVDYAAEIEPNEPGQASRPDVIPILPRTARDLLRSMELPADTNAPIQSPTQASDGTHRVWVELRPDESLNAVSCSVEAQYLKQLYAHYRGDLQTIAEALLGTPDKARSVQLRMNQLGIKLRNLKKRKSTRAPR